ncbi:MAG: hypothetical protein QXK76_00080 [Candidatus Woesearchaeota archaeon]
MYHHKINNIKGIIVFLIIISGVLIAARTLNNEIPLELGILGTMYTFFFGFFINSIFKLLDEKYMNIRIFLGELIGNAQALFNICLLTDNKKFVSQMKKDLIFFLKSFNENDSEKYYMNQVYIDKFFKNLKLIKIKTPKQSQEYSRIINTITNLSIVREKIEIFGKKHIKKETKFILYSNTIIYLLMISIMTFSSGNIYINIVGVLLILMVLFVVFFMTKLDNLSYSSKYIKDKNIEELIEEIEKER